jgi:hypothetical protein
MTGWAVRRRSSRNEQDPHPSGQAGALKPAQADDPGAEVQRTKLVRAIEKSWRTHAPRGMVGLPVHERRSIRMGGDNDGAADGNTNRTSGSPVPSDWDKSFVDLKGPSSFTE